MQRKPPDIPHVSPELARNAREFFQHLYPRPLSEDDGREMAVNVLGAFGVLKEWKAEADARAEAGLPPLVPPPAPKVRGPKRKAAGK